MGHHTAGDTWLDPVSSSDGDTGSRLVIWDQLVIWDHVSPDQGPYQLQITISQKKGDPIFGEAPFKGAEPPVLPFLLISVLARYSSSLTTQRC